MWGQGYSHCHLCGITRKGALTPGSCSRKELCRDKNRVTPPSPGVLGGTKGPYAPKNPVGGHTEDSAAAIPVALGRMGL